MSMPILATKLYIPPARPELVTRPRLIDQLNEGLPTGRKLTLISAPAGFGKTTLAVDWLRQLDVSTAWVSLDESDNDTFRFLTYFVAALQTVEPGIGKGVLGAIQSAQPPPTEAVLTSLINDVGGDPYGIWYCMGMVKFLPVNLRNFPPAVYKSLQRQFPEVIAVIANGLTRTKNNT